MFISNSTSLSILCLFRAIWSKHCIPHKIIRTRQAKSDTQNGSSQKTNILFHKMWTLALFFAKCELRMHITTLGKTSTEVVDSVHRFFHSTCTKLHTQTNHISYDILQLTAQIQIVPYIFCLIVKLQSQQLKTNQLHTQPNPNQVNLSNT
jgi:hypothetical protein